jgi:hypothetical protein
VCWKKLGPYNLKCRKVGATAVVHLVSQLHQVCAACLIRLCSLFHQVFAAVSPDFAACFHQILQLVSSDVAINLLLQVIQLKPQKPLQQLSPLQQQQQLQLGGGGGGDGEAVAMDTCTPTTSPGVAAAADAAAAAVAAAAGGSDDGGGPDAMQQDTPRPQGLSDTAAAAGCHSSDLGDGHAAPMDGISGSGARQQLSAGGTPVLEYTLKFETQMYRLRDDEYSFDIQVRRASGRGVCLDKKG